jgi:queuine tRNA-ribosyltransferase
MGAFRIIAESGRARAGKLVTPHGVIETPAFVPVATSAAVKGLTGPELAALGTQVMIANAYHLHLQPGETQIGELGGLHRFMGWEKPLITDSGGFQVFSLGAGKAHGVGKVASLFPAHSGPAHRIPRPAGDPLVRIAEEGVEFISYRDGSLHHFSPEGVMEIERRLGADIILALDECTSPLHSYEYTRQAMERTHRWAVRALGAFNHGDDDRQALWGIVQGGAYRDLRETSAQFVGSQGFDGYAIGGSLGASKEEMQKVIEWTVPLLPPEQPRHLLGIGAVEDVLAIIARGVDLFDCVAPTLMAQTGTVFDRSAPRFRVHLTNGAYKDDPRPIEEGCGCAACCTYSRAYLRHLLMAKEPLGIRLAAVHNLAFMETLMSEIRAAIKEDKFAGLQRAWQSAG